MTEYLLYALLLLTLAVAIAATLKLDRALIASLQARRVRREKRHTYRASSQLQRQYARWAERRRTLIRDSGLSAKICYVAQALCMAVGFAAGYTIFQGVLIAAGVGLMAALLPLVYLSYHSTVARKSWLEQLNASMLTISNSYVVTNDLPRSIQENLGTLEYPEPFRDFLTYITYIDSDITSGLRRMENTVKEAYFSQWVDALVLAQKDRSLAHITLAIVDSMRDVQTAQRESDAVMSAVWREYIMELALVFASPLALRAVLPEAYQIMVASTVGQALFFLLLLALAFSVAMALRINRPLVT